MSNEYMILSDSEEENDNALPTAMLSDSNDEPDSSASSAAEQTEEENPSEEESDPEEFVPETPESLSPVHSTYSNSGPYMIHTARKSVLRANLNPTIPINDPYQDAFDTSKWSWLPQTLEEWREEMKFPTITEVGESSNSRQKYPLTQEPPHHTVPLLVAKATEQENKIDLIEDALESMPGADAMEELNDRVTNFEQHLDGLRNGVQDLQDRGEEEVSRIESLNQRMTRIERRMDNYERRLEELNALADCTRGYASYILKEQHLTKKKD